MMQRRTSVQGVLAFLVNSGKMGKKDGDAKRKRKRAVFDSESEDDESGADLEEVASCFKLPISRVFFDARFST